MSREDTAASTSGGVGVDEVQERLGRDSTRTFVEFAVGVFLAMGVGYGFTLWLVSSLAGSGSAGSVASFGALFVGLLLAPMTAVLTGTVTGLRMEDDDLSAALAAGVGAGAGLVVMVVVLVLFAAVTGGGSAGGGGTNVGVGPVVGLVLGVGVTGAVAAYATRAVGVDGNA